MNLNLHGGGGGFESSIIGGGGGPIIGGGGGTLPNIAGGGGGGFGAVGGITLSAGGTGGLETGCGLGRSFRQLGFSGSGLGGARLTGAGGVTGGVVLLLSTLIGITFSGHLLAGCAEKWKSDAIGYRVRVWRAVLVFSKMGTRCDTFMLSACAGNFEYKHSKHRRSIHIAYHIYKTNAE